MARSLGGFPAALVTPLVTVDERHPSRQTVVLTVASLTLAGRDYYLDAKLEPTKRALRSYVERLFLLSKWPDPSAAADRVLAFETSLADARLTATKAREAQTRYHVSDIDGLARTAPGTPWRRFLRAAGFGAVRRVSVNSPEELAAVSRLGAQAPVGVLKDWIAFRTLDRAAPYLSSDFSEAWEQFHTVTLRGQSSPRERWRSGLDAVNFAVPADVSRLYLARDLSPETLRQVEAIAAGVKTAFATRIRALAWMDASTKAEALKKLAAMSIEIGAPKHLESYGDLDIRAGDLFGDELRARAWRWRRQVNSLDKPVDRHRWLIPPQFVGAFADESRNLVGVEAASLKAPFFDPKADPAVNYAAIGSTIGHEITHNFDDKGRKYDAQARLRDWWSPADAKHFEAEAGKLASLYAKEEPLPGIHISGRQTLGESLADLGGAVLALDAYHLSLKGSPAPILSGFTGEQRFFLGYAQSERAKESEAFVRSTLLTNPHSPPAARVNETLRNIDGWYRAFATEPSQHLYLAPRDRVRIW